MKTNATARVALGITGLMICLLGCGDGLTGAATRDYYSAIPPKPDWAQIDSGCRDYGGRWVVDVGSRAVAEQDRCTFARGVKMITDSPNAKRLGDYVGECKNLPCLGRELRDIVGAPADFLAKAEVACKEGYQRACVASRLVQIEQKLAEAASKGGRLVAVRQEIGLARAALQRDAIDRQSGRPTTAALLDEANSHADAALAPIRAEEEKAAAEQRAAADRKHQLESETQGITDAAKACETKPTDCKTKCETAKDGASCFAWAANLKAEDPPKLTEARTYYQRACDAGLQSGCAGVANADKLIGEAMGQVDTAWNDLAAVGDDLAQKYYLVKVAQTVNTPRLRNALPQMRAINAAIVTEKYCPAKKTFLAASSFAIRNAPARGRAAPSTAADDFALRSANHCKSDPPMGNGLSGAQVPLNTECGQVYATPCP